MLNKIAVNLKQAWQKTMQDMNEHEARRRVRTERRRAFRLSGRARRVPSAAATTVDEMDVDVIDADDAGHVIAKRRRVDDSGTTAVIMVDDEEAEGGLRHKQSASTLASTQHVPAVAVKENSAAAVERMLRKKIVHLERELRETQENARSLKEQLEEQDDYIRAMEFEKTRFEEEHSVKDDNQNEKKLAQSAAKERARVLLKKSPMIVDTAAASDDGAEDSTVDDQLSPVKVAQLSAVLLDENEEIAVGEAETKTPTTS
ncbi:uncharacterized protein V1518DRAFT_434488 [Limtongia smithiae]|uniref:uncharacterized protein n=1 Tax=Limtongia smithiae TaxID=1125753 RepID=UPI0034CD516E